MFAPPQKLGISDESDAAETEVGDHEDITETAS